MLLVLCALRLRLLRGETDVEGVMDGEHSFALDGGVTVLVICIAAVWLQDAHLSRHHSDATKHKHAFVRIVAQMTHCTLGSGGANVLLVLSMPGIAIPVIDALTDECCTHADAHIY